tara:strand:+ start:1070 stop:1495 length:426 start_codon:yes stop_codon:yes gene_type:complete
MSTTNKIATEPPDGKRTAEIIGFEQGEYPYATRLARRDYEAQKAALQVELLMVQHWVQETGQKFVMLFEGRDAPWTVVRSKDKKRARLNCMLHFLSQIDYPDKDETVAVPPDPKIVLHADTVLQQSDHILAASLHPKTRKP